jgi:DNA-binding response OmpR family regulator
VISLAEVPLPKPLLERQEQQRLVLVVDDERVIADTLSIILSRSGLSVMTAYDGETALKLARASTPDLLLSDVMLGSGIDGTQLAIQMVELFPDCKVLLFSGHAATADLLAKTRRLGHDFTLMTKPVHPADLLARITESFTTAGKLVEA